MILTNQDGTVGFTCDRCGAVAAGDGIPLVFANVNELTIVAQRDGWLGEGELPDRGLMVCPPCRVAVLSER